MRLLRGADLLHLWTLFYRCRLVEGETGPMLFPNDERARLEVVFPFQHLAERAYYVADGKTPAGTFEPGTAPDLTKRPERRVEDADAVDPFDPPTKVRAAHGSRLVFGIPPGESIAYSTEEILAAMSRLPLRVVPLAAPRKDAVRPPAATDPLIAVGGGLALVRGTNGLIVTALGRSKADQATGQDPVVGVLRAARDGIAVRRMLTAESAVDVTPSSRAADVARGVGSLSRRPVPGASRGGGPRRPEPDETAIEAPFRLIVSPSSAGGFAHSTAPAEAPGDATRIELWHSRLGVRYRRDGQWAVDERKDSQRIVRAVWARDMDLYTEEQLARAEDSRFEFTTSLDPRDRRILVRQSAEKRVAVPEPVEVERLYLSSLGAWLDLHGQWDPAPYAKQRQPSILSWDHLAPMGRDQFVRVVYPGYLFPFGHRCAMVKVTERKINERVEPKARLYQRKFLVIGEPSRTYGQPDLPFREVRIRPSVTPDIRDPRDKTKTPHVVIPEHLFWPVVGNEKFRFTLDCLDHDFRRIRLQAPLLFVAAHLGDKALKSKAKPKKGTGTADDIKSAYATDNQVGAYGGSVAFAPSTTSGDTALEVSSFTFAGEPSAPGKMRSRPSLVSAAVVIPSMRHLAPKAPEVTVSYHKDFLDNKGFGGSNAKAELFLRLEFVAKVSYSEGTDRAGGFVEPNLPVTQLSRRLGAVGELASKPGQPPGTFDPKQLLAGVAPRLFGLFDLADVLPALGLDQMPKFVTEALDRVSALLADLERLQHAVVDAVARLRQDALPANAAVKAQLEAAADDLEAAAGGLVAQVGTLVDAVQSVLKPPSGSAPKTPADVADDVEDVLDALRATLGALAPAVGSLPLPPTVKADLERLVAGLKPVLDAGADVLQAVMGFLDRLDPGDLSVRARYVWSPPIEPWPNAAKPIFSVDEPNKAFALSVEARASGAGGAGADVLAEMRGFNLDLLPGAALMRLEFDRLAFRATSGRKPEVDVIFGGITFVGVLGFIETLRKLIPFDGFSDPPYLDVSAEGATAGFDLALPNLAVGVFSLENISLGADCRVPFLGDALSVGFNFCTRERPFRLTVMAIGGGGFVAIRLSPEGLVVLEMALEAGASLSLNLGVASGSVSVMVGVYLRLEGDAGSLTGYFRIRGEVDVLGLISASITLELSLVYEFTSGKMVGRASVVVEVEVLLFSGSVTISVERRLAGSNQDPTFAEIMEVNSSGESAAWETYCQAFVRA
ncbi:MAG: hypothetical protein M3Q48_10815 [Actinomycetota bacterium]|nr:hypothetical protein [Actinomycetota bacterium]